MTIPFFEPDITFHDGAAIKRAVYDGYLGPGKKCDEFASKLAEHTGRKYMLLTTSGTQALSVAAISLGLDWCWAIAMPSYGVAAVPNAFASTGSTLFSG